jgi:hypothetical protein
MSGKSTNIKGFSRCDIPAAAKALALVSLLGTTEQIAEKLITRGLCRRLKPTLVRKQTG